jgi:hypothetical protein
VSKLIAILSAFIALAACGRGEAPPTDDHAAQAEPATGGAAAGQGDAVIPPQKVLAGTWDESLAAGQSLTIVGEFMGNDPQSICEYASTTLAVGPVRTSWDFLIRKDGRCIWVTRGADPRAYNRLFGAPEEMLERANFGRKVEITARIAATGERVKPQHPDRFYLEYVSGAPLDDHQQRP